MSKSLKFAVILSGCGANDGAEIQEAVLTLFAIAKNNCTYTIFAPDIEQMHVINHFTGSEMDEKRNVLIESARIARGEISPLSEFDCKNFDVLMFPGGFGGAKNLSNYAVKGVELKVNAEVEKAIIEMHRINKPIGSLCVTPVIIAKVISKVQLTIGNDDISASHVEELGASHFKTNSGEIVIDKNNKLVTAPCYMLNAKITDIAKETDLVVQSLIDLAGQ